MSLFVEDSINNSFLLKDHIVKYIYNDSTIECNFELVRNKGWMNLFTSLF